MATVIVCDRCGKPAPNVRQFSGGVVDVATGELPLRAGNNVMDVTLSLGFGAALDLCPLCCKYYVEALLPHIVNGHKTDEEDAISRRLRDSG